MPRSPDRRRHRSPTPDKYRDERKRDKKRK